MPRLRGVLAVATAACGLAAIGTGQAAARPVADTITVTIAAQSRLKPVGYEIFVVFDAGPASAVRLSGSISGGKPGDVAVLYAQRFPYTSKPVRERGQFLALTSTKQVSYSFTATPLLATRYLVELRSGGTAVAQSPVATVYVTASGKVTGVTKCGRPVCHQTLHLFLRVPVPAYRTESSKRWYFYFGLHLSSTGRPRLPFWLYLDSRVTISKARRISATEFERTFSWSFRIGNDGYSWFANSCARDTESRDGFNLPGSHGCGTRRVRQAVGYLG